MRNQYRKCFPINFLYDMNGFHVEDIFGAKISIQTLESMVVRSHDREKNLIFQKL